MRAYRIYLLRHGLTEANASGRYIGTTDLDLSEDGIARLCAMQSEYEYPGVGRVYCSPLKRCVQTARLLYPQITPTTVEELRECSFGVFENKTAKELSPLPEYRAWLDGKALPEGAEDPNDFSRRVLAGLDRIVQDMMKDHMTDAAVIAHGGVIQTILTNCGMPRQVYDKWAVSPGEGYTLLINASLWSNAHIAEVFTPLPYGKNKDAVMLDYQRELPEE